MTSSPPPGLTSKRLESLSSKKPNRGIDHLDDASSFTSMSSNSNATVCRVCKGAESLTAPLVTCIRCRSRYHMGCPNPRIIDRRVDYTCGRCVEKAKKNPTTAPAILSNRAGTDEPQRVKVNQRAVETQTTRDAQQAMESQNALDTTIIMCETENCGKPAKPLKAPNTRHLCFMCGLVERSNSARQLPPPKPAQVSRPIQKTKLYHVRPDDRPLVTNKRKRASSGHTSITRAEGPRASAVPKANLNSNNTVTSGLSSRAPAQNQFKKQKSVSSDERQVTQNPSSMKEPLGRVSSVTGANPPHVYRNFLPVDDSLEHETSLSQVNNASNQSKSLTSETRSRDGRPSPQGVSEPIFSTPNIAQVPQVNSPIEEQLPPLEPIVTHPEMPSQESPLGEDEEMLGAAGPRPLFPQPPSPLSDSFSYHVPSPKIPNFDDDIEPADTPSAVEPDIESESPGASCSFETADGFDESDLDSFIQRQSQRDPFYEPSPTELLETQIWGAVDPRTIWPKRLSAAQREQKMREIVARGGRKKNFGKILHPQLIQERLERGWGIHQSREKRDDEETREMIQKLEELFGAPEGTLGNCVPRTIDGRLVMQEREREPEPRRPGKQKKEVPLGVYPVVGGQ